jgi:hypothetical protein
MFNETSKMPNYQWKLTIVERNLLPFNWLKLMPDAQEQMLWETDCLLAELPLTEKQRLLSLLANLENYLEASFQQKTQQILNNHSPRPVAA